MREICCPSGIITAIIPTVPPHVKAPPGARQFPDHGSQSNCGMWVKACLTLAEREWDFPHRCIKDRRHTAPVALVFS